MRLPEWVRTKYRPEGVFDLKRMLRRRGLNTVCEEARCPNIGQCFSRPAAAFLILGPRCTRACGFCAVERLPAGDKQPVRDDEPEQVALCAKDMGLKYVVITSVTRDDLVPDGGASQFARAVRAVKALIPGVKVEVLTPDFMGAREALKTVLEALPDVFNHNVETVPGLYPSVRPQADYQRSLGLLRAAKEFAPAVPVKSGLMLGLGETEGEVAAVMSDLRAAGCEMLTLGQYLRPSKRKNLPVVEYVEPERFQRLRDAALAMGFSSVASGPLVRSSMNAEEYYSHV